MAGHSTSVNSAIKIYCRIKPLIDTNIVPYDILSTDAGEEMIQMSCKDDHPTSIISQAYLNSKPEQYKFRFQKVFDRTSRQDYVFYEVAKPVIDSALQGYNGTIFAYGQTGTGKTYTMTGNRTSFHDRGIIPRALEYLFQQFEQDSNPNKVRNVFVSYLEIYNEAGYDLLNPSAMTGRMDDLGRVTLMEDGSQQMHLRNLSVHSIASVEEATQFLYLGDHNRTIAETPVNEASTRSHCIFTIHLNIRDVNTSLTTRSKLHLVDLAGSERVSTISTTSQLATEARHINLALHYLEQVIVALGDSNRTHIPYRNSMMTSVLRDSLGGNCMTSMIATISLDPRNTQETLSTCRFAQRVAMVTNALQRNEDLDPNLIITQLKSEVKKLRAIIESNAISKPLKEASTVELTEDEIAICSYAVQQFLSEKDPKIGMSIPPDLRMIQECFRILKYYIPTSISQLIDLPKTPIIDGENQLAIEGSSPSVQQESSPKTSASSKSQRRSSSSKHLSSLTSSSHLQLLAQRDAEIKVLMDMLRKEKTKSRSQTATTISDKPSIENLVSSVSCVESGKLDVTDRKRRLVDQEDSGDDKIYSFLFESQQNPFDDTPGIIPMTGQSERPCGTPPPSQVSMLPDEDETKEPERQVSANCYEEQKRHALAAFMANYEGTVALTEKRELLQQRKAETDALEEKISACEKNIQAVKKVAETTGDMGSASMILSNQEQALAQHQQALKIALEEMLEMQQELKDEYKVLASRFEEWWKIAQKIGVIEVGHVKGSLEPKIDEGYHDDISAFFTRSGKGERPGDVQQSKPNNDQSSSRPPLKSILKNSEPTTNTTILPPAPPPSATSEACGTEESPGSTKPQFQQEVSSTNGETVFAKILRKNDYNSSDDDSSFEDTPRRPLVHSHISHKNGIPITGDVETDQEVLQFLQARKQVFQVMKNKQQTNEMCKI